MMSGELTFCDRNRVASHEFPNRAQLESDDPLDSVSLPLGFLLLSCYPVFYQLSGQIAINHSKPSITIRVYSPFHQSVLFCKPQRRVMEL